MTQSKDDNTFNLDDFTINIADDYLEDSNTITINMNEYTADTIDISSISTAMPDWDNTITSITFDRVLFEDYMPDVERVKGMCEEYPAFKKAFEQFKLIYKMTEQDYKGKLKERGLDDDIPF